VTDDPAHRGYYWLAYAEQNLLPSCEKCNRAEGKKSRFPIEGSRATSPGDDLDAELPLLLNPYHAEDCNEASNHFAYDYELIGGEPLFNGLMKATSRRGEESIRIYNLNRPPLVRKRADSQLHGVNALKLVWLGDAAALDLWSKQWLLGENEHSQAVRAACRIWWQHKKAVTDRLLA